MTFKLWESKVYVLKEGWNTFCQKHSLREHEDFVTVRCSAMIKLCFSISSRRLRPCFVCS
ncbi:hypothetical protein SO802_022810 [Lithocarpus litseifolius]|uniref:TF-B3 domain-containing protein n=1 Tax=Lithocarpus litseifolius TaxID=425828 RepID=A0AAW2C6U6_9ROSI